MLNGKNDVGTGQNSFHDMSIDYNIIIADFFFVVT